MRAGGADDVMAIAAHDEDVKDRFLSRYPGGMPLVIETSATEWGLRQSFAVAAMQGRITLTGGGALDLSGWDIVMRELEIHGSRASHHQEEALALIAAGEIDLKPTITHRFPLDQAPAAFTQLTGPDAKDIGRVIIECSPAADRQGDAA